MEKGHNLPKSDVIEQVPLACSSELAAVEFLETLRWRGTPCCIHCGSVNVYQMLDAKTGERSRRFLWRCRDCKEQYTVRIGTIYEESRIELRHWCYAFWRAATSKKGVSALEIRRHCQISYKSALFLMNRIRFAMLPDFEAPKQMGTVECAETYVDGHPRYQRNQQERPWQEQNASVCSREEADNRSRIVTDENSAYRGIGLEYAGGHESVCHGAKEYARGDVHTNTAESSFALVKRGIVGIYHNVSREHLHRYLWQFEFCLALSQAKRCGRTVLAIQGAEGKRLLYKGPIDSVVC